MKKYNPQKIEGKWQKKWLKTESFSALDSSKKEKFYCLDMFPYPSSYGLHVGHPEGYTATDIVSRYKRMKGFEVIHPMGWDAFGLPAENFAIKSHIHPKETTKKSIATFKKQIQSLGLSYDWDREISTADPEYYKWTQWIFLKLYENGLAYKKKAAVNWCESCKTVLANEQVQDGKCERCKNIVVQKDLEQWFFKTTAYAQKLLDGLKHVDWPQPIKLMQENWIGKSEGAEIEFSISNFQFSIKVFTTRPDTLYGATYMVLAPEHELVSKITSQEQKKEVEKYLKKSRKKTELERTDLAKEKTGVFTGAYAINPATKKKIPIWVADYVLSSYGTGAIMAVPAHDERDFEFAKKYKLEIIKVLDSSEDCYSGEGKIINSDEFNDLDNNIAKKNITEKVGGKLTTQYKLKDWLISRQRYWGAPIPIIYCEKCGEVPVLEKDLPVELPDDVDFKPKGESPLVKSKTFHQVKCPKCGQDARREVDTMDTFVCSSWYYLRYCDPHNEKEFASNEKLKKWMPVDLYVGGAEHACMHLIYARFIYKVLKDLGYVKIDEKADHNEPYQKLMNQGMILGEDHQKMSKSRGNVINPDDVIKEYGADTLRLYEMFMGTFSEVKPWDTKSIKGVYRFLDRVWHLQDKVDAQGKAVGNILHKTIKKVSEDIERFGFNTAISQMMILTNEMSALDKIYKSDFEKFLIILSPFAPHMAEELWELLGNKKSIFLERWPDYDKALIQDKEAQIIIQINGKLRDKIMIDAKHISDQKRIEELAMASEKVQKFIGSNKVKKIFYVKGRLLNIVV
ncbi:MAG: leucine--tRNA ligase [Patescibacteria group bacterium]|jgi:leucyl-tRNA synthetase